ncbi:Protein N-acetyltransferase, RimJ/RimL family [Litchfieldia salsa]|uniref:Protein N-acetyltransferase, RimJ/RimL family n=2 Tax=Litchfieldia salsa TaxID=930152 RepID=A0A1H0SWI6_9BACI|nr:Protein N-acetyltransferase, RimJ/RimL family [Litchfieldia salsa]
MGCTMIYNHSEKTIKTDRLILRLFRESDAKKISILCNNYHLYKNTLYLPYPYSIDDALGWIKNHLSNYNDDRMYEFAVTDKETGELYGAIGLSHNKNAHNGEIGYWIGEEYWGNGYATEAAKGMVEFAFTKKKFHKVYARYFTTNTASGRVLEKIGMKQEGILREHVMKDKKYIDLVYYGIINHEV